MLDHAGRRVLRYDACARAFAPVPCVYDGVLNGARDVAITDAGDLAVTDTGHRRLLVATSGGLALRRVLGPLRAWLEDGAWRTAPVVPELTVPDDAVHLVATWPDGTWEPWGVAAGAGRLVVTDRANGLVHLLDEGGRWCSASAGSGPGLPPLERPTAVALDREGRINVLQEGQAVVRVLDARGVGVEDVDTLDERRRAFCPLAVAVGPHGELCVAGGGRVHLAGGGAVAACGAAVRGLAFDRDGNALVTDGSRRCVVRLVAGGGYVPAGRFVAGPLDSRLAGCVWHRVLLAGRVASGTTVTVRTLTAEVALTPGELPDAADARWAGGHTFDAPDLELWDCLTDSPPGRYLWLALELAGDGSASPSIESVQVDFPRRTSLERLPATYRAAPDSADFLDRLLGITDTVRAGVTTHLDRMPALFDPEATPAGTDGGPDFLTWLESWLGVVGDEGLPVARRRRLLAASAELYRLRGTPAGVRRYVALICGVEVRLLEHYRLRRWAIAGHARLGDASKLFGPEIVRRLQLDAFSRIGDFQLVGTDDPRRDPFLVHADRFTVFLLAGDEHDEAALLRLGERAVELAKPAHALADVVVVRPRLRVGVQATIGVNSVVGGAPAPTTVGEGRLHRGLVLAPDPRPAGHAVAGVSSRIGIDLTLT